MFRTRAGVTMRAVVDNRDLASLTGARPALSSSLSWALGSSLAALAGILLAPVLQLNVQALTLLVVNAYAAAMFGRLRSVPLTFVGAVVLGLVESYAVGYLPSDGAFTNIRVAIPTLMLFVDAARHAGGAAHAPARRSPRACRGWPASGAPSSGWPRWSPSRDAFSDDRRRGDTCPGWHRDWPSGSSRSRSCR